MSLTDQQTDAAIEWLAKGYGVEDIALRMGLSADDIRGVVHSLRANGLLVEIYAGDEGE